MHHRGSVLCLLSRKSRARIRSFRRRGYDDRRAERSSESEPHGKSITGKNFKFEIMLLNYNMATQAQALLANRGGKRAKRQANHSAIRDSTLIMKDEDQEYARVLKVLGNCRFTVSCFDGRERLAILRGKLTYKQNRKDNLIGQDDYVLVGTRGYEPTKCDIILKYTHTQVRELIKRNELPIGSSAQSKCVDDDDTTGFDFETI